MGKKRKQTRPKKHNKYDNLSKPEAEFDFHDRGRLTMGMVRELARISFWLVVVNVD
jgi:hypothetical protein